MFDRHQMEITVMQFKGHSLPVRQSMSVPWDSTLSHIVSQARQRMFGRVEGQYTTSILNLKSIMFIIWNYLLYSYGLKNAHSPHGVYAKVFGFGSVVSEF